MHNEYMSLEELYRSLWYSKKKNQKPKKYQNQVLKSRRIEDNIYDTLRKNTFGIDYLEDDLSIYLTNAKNLTRDVFQALYSLDISYHEQSQLLPNVRHLNRHLLNSIIQSEKFPQIKNITEGRGAMAIEATEEFILEVYNSIEELLNQANGDNNALDILEKQEKNHNQRHKEFLKMLEEQETTQTKDSEKKILKYANKLYSQDKQLEYLNKTIRDNLAKSKEARQIIYNAIDKMADKATELQSIISSWGDGSSSGELSQLNLDMLDKARSNPTLLGIAKYLGRLKESIKHKRKNAFSYGRGEKYSVEYGNNFSRLLTSELAMLSATETTALFLKKLQSKSLKQYARRDKVSKIQGDIIVCLDESASTNGENATWGKAISFALLDIAQQSKRNFALVHFSSKDECQTDIFKSGKYTQDDIIKAAEKFFNGGTNFETPLKEAIRLMEEEGFYKGDIVFITDGECSVSDKFRENFAIKKSSLKATVTGILMDVDSPGMQFSLTPFCDEIVRISEVGYDRAGEIIAINRA